MEKEPAQTRIRRVYMGEASHQSLLFPPIAFFHSLLPSFPTVQQAHAHGFVPFRVGHGQDVRVDEFDVQIRLSFLALGFPGCFFVLRGGKGPKRTRDMWRSIPWLLQCIYDKKSFADQRNASV